MIPLTRKYAPKRLDEVKGQDEAVSQLKDFLKNFPKGKKRAMLLHGPTGTGKTSSAHAAAKDLDLEIFELNASDARSKANIQEKVGAALSQRSLFGGSKLVLIDDIDGLSGTKDRGALPTLIKLIESSPFPVVMTALDAYNRKIRKLKSKAIFTAFEPLDTKDIAEHLMNIAKKEGIALEDEAAKSIARRSGGDMRAAINDLEIVSHLSKVTKADLEALGLREKEESITHAITKVFKTTDPLVAIHAFDNVSDDMGERLLWLDENLPNEYKHPADLARAYDMLSKADVFKGRIMRWQHWRFLVYVNALMSAGVATAKDKKYDNAPSYKPTGRILKMWWAKQKSLKKRSIASKIAEKVHASQKEVLNDFSLYKAMIKKDKAIAEQLDLDKDELDWLKK